MDGEWKSRRANDLVAGAAGGIIAVSGEPRGTPVQGGANPSLKADNGKSALYMAIEHRAFAIVQLLIDAKADELEVTTDDTKLWADFAHVLVNTKEFIFLR